MRALFPKKPPDFRRNLSPYQEKKIKKALREVKNYGGAYVADFVPMGRGRKKYLADADLPPYMRGIFLPGGEKVNKKLQFVKGAIKYERGGQERERYELETGGDENDLIDSAKEILKNRKNRRATITANGRAIGGAANMKDNGTVLKEASYIFLKYAEMHEKGEVRERMLKGGMVREIAAHPNEWGMGILFERGGTDVNRTGRKKQTGKKKQAGKKKAK